MIKTGYEDAVRRFSKEIYRYCLYKLNNDDHTAQDALNEVMLTLYVKWDGFDNTDNIRAWLYRCADNIVKRKLKDIAKHLRNTMPIEEMIEEPGREDEYFSDDKELTESCICRIKAELDGDAFELFRLRFIEKKALVQICTLKGIPFSTLRYRLSKIEGKVKEIIRKNY